MHHTKLSLSLLASLLFAACGSSSPKPEPVEPPTTIPASAGEDIVDIAMAAGSFNTLLKALDTAGLKGVLEGDGPFTVFAPTDAAFDLLPPGTLDSLLADKDKLTALLSYHVVKGKLSSTDVAAKTDAKTSEGSDLTIDASGGPSAIKINTATILQADIAASNGVIHVLDSVLIPPPTDG